jgi:hypothetical protein
MSLFRSASVVKLHSMAPCFHDRPKSSRKLDVSTAGVKVCAISTKREKCLGFIQKESLQGK